MNVDIARCFRARFARLGRAFTLIEVLLALVLMAMLFGAVTSFLWDLGRQRRVLANLGSDLHAGGLVIERIEQDLVGVITADARAGAGVIGTATKLRLLSRGVWPGGGKAGSSTDLVATEMEYDLSSGEVRGARWAVINDADSVAPSVMARRVARLRLRYFSGREWVESFNSLEEGTLPAAIEVAMWFDPVQGGADVRGATGVDPVAPRWGQPDRLRVLAVPDGPGAAWRSGGGA